MNSNTDLADFVIAHISDLHFGRTLKTPKRRFFRRVLGISEHSYNLAVSLSTAISKLKERFGDKLAVVVTGDLTTSANAAAFGTVANYLKHTVLVGPGLYVGLDIKNKLHVVRGNHDAFLFSALKSQHRAEVYHEYFPGLFPVFDIWSTVSGYVTFFYLDSNRVSGFNPFNILNLVQKGEVGIQQRGDLAAIEQALRDRTHDKIPADYDYGSSFKIALLHHHVSCPAEGDMGAELSELRDSRQVLEVLSQMGIALVLYGHQHMPYHGTVFVGGRELLFSCAGSATKDDEFINSFKVYYFKNFTEIFMEEYVASTASQLYNFDLGRSVFLRYSELSLNE